MLPAFSYLRPTTLKETVAALSAGGRVHAGGTDLLGCLRDGVFATDRVITLTALDELRGISPAADGGLTIGALATIAEVASDATVRTSYRALAEAAALVGSPQLRNQGTLGGNLGQKPRCWYYRGDFHCLRKGGETCFAYEGENRYHCIFGGDRCFYVHPSDTAPALAALEASVTVVGPGGARSLAVADLFVAPSVDPQRETVLAPDEVIAAIHLPAPRAGSRSTYRKVRERASWDFALVAVALALELEGNKVRRARVVFGGVAAIPWRSHEAEEAITGHRLDGATITAACKAAVAKAEALRDNAYKIPLASGLLAERLEAIAKG